MKVSRYNYRSQFGHNPKVLFADIHEMLLGGQYILTDHVARFECEFGEYLGVRNVRGVNSGTDALLIALQAVGVKPGDEVITHANTFYATVAAIRLAGATPVLVDADEDSFLMDERQVANAITERTRIILPVHLYGKPTPMHLLRTLATRHGLRIIEDAAQAHGARFKGQAVGTFGGFKPVGKTLRRFEAPVVGSGNLFHGFRDVAALESTKWTMEQRRQLMLDAQATLLLDVAESVVSLGVRELCCRLGVAGGSFERAAGNLDQAARVKMSE